MITTPKSDRFGNNEAAKASEEVHYLIDITKGTVCEDTSTTNSANCLKITSAVGSYQLTQASRLTAQAIASTELHGIVVDWGCGGGLLALLAASQPTVQRVIGLDYEVQNMTTCRHNALQNNLEDKTEFYPSDSFEPLEEQAKQQLQSLYGKVDFVIANPPASRGDDGFSFRRRILNEAMPFLKPNAKVLLQALSYYGSLRFIQAAKEATEQWNKTSTTMEYKYLGIVKSSPWMELGSGPGGYDFKEQIQQYCREETRGGLRYYCGYKDSEEETTSDENQQLTAIEAMSLWQSKGRTPMCQWHVHALQWGFPKEMCRSTSIT